MVHSPPIASILCDHPTYLNQNLQRLLSGLNNHWLSCVQSRTRTDERTLHSVAASRIIYKAILSTSEIRSLHKFLTRCGLGARFYSYWQYSAADIWPESNNRM
jgi:hypothetical protein